MAVRSFTVFLLANEPERTLTPRAYAGVVFSASRSRKRATRVGDGSTLRLLLPVRARRRCFRISGRRTVRADAPHGHPEFARRGARWAHGPGAYGRRARAARSAAFRRVRRPRHPTRAACAR